MRTIKLEVIIERNEDMFTARFEDKGKFALAVGSGDTLDLAFKDLIEIIKDYQENEGKTDKFWQKVDPAKIDFDLRYDLQAFFEEHDYLNTTAVAKRAGINPGLVRQYTSGVKHPSLAQAKKLESTIHKLAKELAQVSLYA
jgi:hypothetical protein